MTTVGDDFPKEQARVREALAVYRSIGPEAAFAIALIEATLRQADEAMASGDLVRILQAYQAMKDIQL